MKKEFRVITGTAPYVEEQLNQLKLDWILIVIGMAATDNSTTVIVECYPPINQE